MTVSNKIEYLYEIIGGAMKTYKTRLTKVEIHLIQNRFLLFSDDFNKAVGNLKGRRTIQKEKDTDHQKVNEIWVKFKNLEIKHKLSEKK